MLLYLSVGNAPVAQPVEHMTFNHGVRSSILRWITTQVPNGVRHLFFIFLAGTDMYSKKAKITQAIYEAALPLCFTLVSSIDTDVNVVLLFALFVLFYCVPLIFTSYKLSHGADDSVRSCILHSLLFLLLPFSISAIVTDIFVSVIAGAQSWSGMTSFILILSAILVTLVFWVKYVLDKKFNNRP